jgi:apolipoprotein N-acyltransferase
MTNLPSASMGASPAGSGAEPKARKSLRFSLILSGLAGVMIPLGFDPWGLAFLMPFAFMILALATDRCGFRRSLLLGWVFGLGVQGASLPWIMLAAKNYLGIFVLNDPDSLIAWLSGIGLFLVWWPLSSLGWGLCLALVSLAPEAPGTRQRIWKCLGIFIFVALYEQYWPRLFPWSVGSGLATAEPSAGWILLRQWGVEVTSLVIASSGFLAAHIFPLVFDFFDQRQRVVTLSRVWLLIPGLAVASLTLLPLPNRGPSPQLHESGREVVVSLVQPAIPLEDRHGAKWRELNETLLDWLSVVEEDSEKSLRPKDGNLRRLTVFPEGMIPGVHDAVSLRRWAQMAGIDEPLLSGVMVETAEGFANAVALIRPLDSESGVRDYSVLLGFKKDLVPFGERIPGESIFEALGWKPPITGLVAGDRPIVFDLDSSEHGFGVSICYEGLLPGTSRGLQESGAQWHVNVTEDLWYGDFLEPAQHLQLQRSRSIESSLPLLRCTNAGLTVAFDPQAYGQQTLLAYRTFPGDPEWQTIDAAGEIVLDREIGEAGMLQVRLRSHPQILKGPLLQWPTGWAPILGGIWVLAGLARIARLRRSGASPA